MFERFTKDSRRLLVVAQEQSARFASGHIGTEHVLLGVLQVAPELVQLLVAPDTTVDAIRAHVEDRIRAEAGEPSPQEPVRPFSPRSKQVLERGLREALRLGHNEIQVGHILLGLRNVEGCMAATLLRELGSNDVRVEALREAVRAGLPSKIALSTKALETAAARAWTPGARAAYFVAVRLSATEPLSTVSLLRGLLREDNGLAARALSHLGVTEATLDEALEDLDVRTTSDSPPEPEVVTVKIGEVEGTFTIPAGEPPEAAQRLKDAIASGRLEEVMREALGRLGVDPDDPDTPRNPPA